MKRIGIFLFYHPKGIVYDYVTYLLADITKSLDELIIVCNGYLREDGREKLQAFASCVYERPNKGFDAAAWQQVILERLEDIRRYDELILFNDSFFGPLYPFKEVFEEMDGRELDFWGLSVHGTAPANRAHNPSGVRPRYLQTYFMAFRKRMLMSSCFEDYWKTLPVYDTFTELVEKHACLITKHFEDLGFTWAAYADTTDLESDDPKKNCSHHMYDSYEMIAKRRLPIIKRKTFIMPKEAHLRYGMADVLPKALDYIREHTQYDTGMIWDYLLDHYNIADIKESLNLTYVLSSKYCAQRDYSKRKIAVIAHLFFPDLFEESCALLCNVPEYADIYVTTSSEEKRVQLMEILSRMGRADAQIRIVQPRGRDLSALLVGCADVTMRYDYLCFVHDKKSSAKECVTVGAAFRKLIMDNVLASKAYISNVLETFEENPRLGIMVPPNVYHGSYFLTSLDYWTICYDKAIDLLGRLRIQVPIARNKMPVSVGSVFWCRTQALRPLFTEKWKCEDFPAEPLAEDGTFSHALERIIPYVAQSQRYYTGTIMTEQTAAAETENYRYMMSSTMRVTDQIQGVDCRTFTLYLKSLNMFVQRLGAAHQKKHVEKLQRFKMAIRRFTPAPIWNGLKKLRDAATPEGRYQVRMRIKKYVPSPLWQMLKRIRNVILRIDQE